MATRIREIRKKKGLTLLDVSKALGVSESTIQRYESGAIKNLKYETMVQLADILHCSPAYLMGWVDVDEVPDNLIPLPETVRLPILGRIACGEPILATENVEGYADVPVLFHADFVLVCQGDSMIGARIHHGDCVYIRAQPDVENGEIAAVLIGEECTLKRVYKNEGVLVLQPENPTYKPIIVTQDSEPVRILGKAVGFSSPL